LNLAVAGKGGVGKTTVAALLAEILSRRGPVVCVDADPDANFGVALGFPPEELRRLQPLSELRELIKERTGAAPGEGGGGLYTLNPRVDDILEGFGIRRNRVSLLVMGGVQAGGGGCVCPEATLLKAVLRHLLRLPETSVVCDMEAGLEHLGRATAQGVDALVLVVEPGRRSFATAARAAGLAADIGIGRVVVVANKLRSLEEDAAQVAEAVAPLPLVSALPFDPQAVTADLRDLPPAQACPGLLAEVETVVDRLSST